jgi:hypothetical protein
MGAPHIGQFGKFTKLQTCGAARVTAAGAGDNTAVTGATIDTRGYGSAKFCVAWMTTLASAQTLKIAAEYQESDDNSSWDTAVALQAATTVKTGAATAALGTTEFNVEFGGKANGTASASQTLGRRYIRFNYTPDLSAGSADTADTSAVAVLGGATDLPTT